MSQLVELILMKIPNIEQHTWILWVFIILIVGGWIYIVGTSIYGALNKKQTTRQRIYSAILGGVFIWILIYLFIFQ